MSTKVAGKAVFAVQWRQGVPDEEGWWLLWFTVDKTPCIRRVTMRTSGRELQSSDEILCIVWDFDSFFTPLPANNFEGRVGGMISFREERV